MSQNDPMEVLLGQLNQGELEAVQRTFVTYEPYLRMIVRRRLSGAMRLRFDSLDIIQSVWADLIRGFRAGAWTFASAGQLRRFLVRATLHRLVDRTRREQRSLRREQQFDPVGLRSLPETGKCVVSAGMEAEELWQEMVDLCPPQHRDLLALRRQGLALADIAARTGLHQSSVRRVLYELAARVARRHA
jgi:RNA polymerase sigma-70 factor (ECF subfamily)